MINFEKIANGINKRGLMNKPMRDMSTEDMLYLCKVFVSSQNPGYIKDHETLRSCFKHNYWWVYKSNCEKCDKKEICPTWTE